MAYASFALGSVRASNFTTSSPATLAPATTSAYAFDFASVFVQKQPYQLYQQSFAGAVATVPGVSVRMAGRSTQTGTRRTLRIHYSPGASLVASDEIY